MSRSSVRLPIRLSMPALLAVGAGLLAVGCAGATSSPSVASPVVASPSAAASPSVAASAEPDPSPSAAANELEIVANDFSFNGPASVAGGITTISLKNDGKEDHQAQFARIAEGKTFDDLLTALQQPDPSGAFALITFSGGPTAVPPGSTGTVTGTLDPGTYALICFIQGTDGVPHLAKGMVAPLEVTAATSPGELPAGTADIGMKDFEYAAPATLTAGHQVVTVTNNGPQPHEATVVKLNEGVTVDDVKAAFASATPPGGPLPFTSAGGIAAIPPNSKAAMHLDLAAGEYALICFVPDPASGKAHAQLGMVGGFTVQ